MKVADLCVFVANVANGEEMVINQQADLILTSLRSQGLPTCIGLTQGLECVQNAKSKTNLKKYATRFLFPSLLLLIDYSKVNSMQILKFSMIRILINYFVVYVIQLVHRFIGDRCVVIFLLKKLQ